MKKFFSLLIAVIVSSAAFAAVHTVQVKNFAYDPASLDIMEGDIVRFEWVEGTHPTVSDDGYWTTFTMDASNQMKEITFNDAGTYNYHCQFHAGGGMTGVITVTSVTGNKASVSNKVKIYPNPATEKVNIDLNGVPADEVEVKSLCGHTVKSQELSASQTSVDVDLPHGEYLLIIKRRGEVIESKKLLVGK